MENGPFIDEFPIKTSIFQGFSMAMLNNQMVSPKRSLRISVAIRVLGGFNMFQLRCLFHFIPYPWGIYEPPNITFGGLDPIIFPLVI